MTLLKGKKDKNLIDLTTSPQPPLSRSPNTLRDNLVLTDDLFLVSLGIYAL